MAIGSSHPAVIGDFDKRGRGGVVGVNSRLQWKEPGDRNNRYCSETFFGKCEQRNGMEFGRKGKK